jgi:hypothetical protein
MAHMTDSTTGRAKETWTSPKLEELGNLRDFVRTGFAFGKSGTPADGSSDPGGESMPKD